MAKFSLHSLFKSGDRFKKFGFIESAVILGFGIGMIAYNKGDISSILNIYWAVIGGTLSKKVKLAITLSYLATIILSILFAVYKRLKICTSLTCYCEENSDELKKNKKLINGAVGASTLGLLIATPLVYILSYFFKILFVKYINEEKRACKLDLEKTNNSKKE